MCPHRLSSHRCLINCISAFSAWPRNWVVPASPRRRQAPSLPAAARPNSTLSVTAAWKRPVMESAATQIGSAKISTRPKYRNASRNRPRYVYIHVVCKAGPSPTYLPAAAGDRVIRLASARTCAVRQSVPIRLTDGDILTISLQLRHQPLKNCN